MVEADVDVLAAHREDRLVGSGIGAVGDDDGPRVAEVARLRDDRVALSVLEPRGVERPPVHGIDHDLGVDLLGARGRDRTRRVPACSAIATDLEDRRRARARRTPRNALVLGVEDVDAAMIVGGDGRLPLVAHVESQPRLGREAGRPHDHRCRRLLGWRRDNRGEHSPTRALALLIAVRGNEQRGHCGEDRREREPCRGMARDCRSPHVRLRLPARLRLAGRERQSLFLSLGGAQSAGIP
jgi:hypothetical protein